jgi:hypothetical protein
MAEGDRLPDDAVVVRCGLPPFLGRPLDTACDEHPSGFYGFSVQATAGLTVEQLASECRNSTVGYTTVREIRMMGYEVRETSGTGPHATVVVPRPWSPKAAEQLARLFRPAKNPSPKRRP